MAYEMILYAVDGRIATITLNRPERAFVETAKTRGVGAAVKERDAPFADYSQAPLSRRPRKKRG